MTNFGNMDNAEGKYLGVPVEEIHSILGATTLKSVLTPTGLEVSYEDLKATVLVQKPPVKDAPIKDIQAIITTKTYLPPAMVELLSNPELRTVINSLATLGAVIEDEDGLFMGSRLTVYEDETAWSIYEPLILYSLIVTNEIFAHTMMFFLGDSEPKSESSAWTEDDFLLTQSYLEKMCVCNSGGLGFTAEFGNTSENLSAIVGHQTSLWRMLASEPHPVLGGGLFCLLELPFSFGETQIPEIANLLNRSEMLPNDLPPHFGAWTAGKRGDTVAYVSFLPNIFHQEAKNIQVNMSMWAIQRNQFAYATLASHGLI